MAYEDTDDTEQSAENINDDTISNYIVFGFIRIFIESASSLNIPNEIGLICLCYYSHLPYINSSILTENDKNILIEFLIERNIYKSSKNMKFNLLFNAKNHNFSAEQFHKKCDNKFGTITLIENECGNIFGIYLSGAWIPPSDKNGKTDYDFCDYGQYSFIFKLRALKSQCTDTWSSPHTMYNLNEPKMFIDDLQTYIYPEYNIKYGPSFGGPAWIKIPNHCNKIKSSCKHHYEKKKFGVEICGSEDLSDCGNSTNGWDFLVVNYEVFHMENQDNKMDFSYLDSSFEDDDDYDDDDDDDEEDDDTDSDY